MQERPPLPLLLELLALPLLEPALPLDELLLAVPVPLPLLLPLPLPLEELLLPDEAELLPEPLPLEALPLLLALPLPELLLDEEDPSPTGVLQATRASPAIRQERVGPMTASVSRSGRNHRNIRARSVPQINREVAGRTRHRDRRIFEGSWQARPTGRR